MVPHNSYDNMLLLLVVTVSTLGSRFTLQNLKIHYLVTTHNSNTNMLLPVVTMSSLIPWVVALVLLSPVVVYQTAKQSPWDAVQ